MTARLDVPFNINLLALTPEKLARLKPVTSLDSFYGATQNYNEDGLYSISIFGRVGDDARSKRFSYIDIRLSVMHPIIWRAIGKLKQLYHGILTGTEYAVFDNMAHDFVRSDVINGKTGYQFFLDNWKKIMFVETKSTERHFNIALVKKYMSIALTSKILVEPAGLRDMQMTADGRHEEDEINDLYRKLLAISNTIALNAIQHNPEVLNITRVALQNTFNQIYTTFEAMLEGKRKLIQGKWAARRIQNGTRNVITAMNTSVAELGDPGNIGFNNSGVGLYQFSKAVMPIMTHALRTGFLSEVFFMPNQPAILVNKKTLKAEPVTLSPLYYDNYMTNTGLEKIIKSFAQDDVRHRPLEIGDHYLGLIYKGKDGTFRLMHDISELPSGYSEKEVFPLTFAEWLYTAIYLQAAETPIFVTRYPIASQGSIYPSMAYLHSTVKAERRIPLDLNWQPVPEKIAYQFPITGLAFMNSLVPHPARLQGLGGDFDGDTCSANAAYSDEAKAEIKAYLKSRRAYVDSTGQFLSSCATHTLDLVFRNMTGAPVN